MLTSKPERSLRISRRIDLFSEQHNLKKPVLSCFPGLKLNLRDSAPYAGIRNQNSFPIQEVGV